MRKLAAISISSLALILASPVFAADVGVGGAVGTSTGVQTGPETGAVNSDAGVHTSTSTSTGANVTTPPGATTTKTNVTAPANTMATVTSHLSSQGYSNVQRYNDASASSNNDLAFTAKNKAGQNVLVTVDAQTGAVLSEKPQM